MSIEKIISDTVDECLQSDESDEDMFLDFKKALIDKVKAFYKTTAAAAAPVHPPPKPAAKPKTKKSDKAGDAPLRTYPRFVSIFSRVYRGDIDASEIMVTPVFNFSDETKDACTIYVTARDNGEVDVEGHEQSLSDLVKTISGLFTNASLKRTASVWGLLSNEDRITVVDSLS